MDFWNLCNIFIFFICFVNQITYFRLLLWTAYIVFPVHITKVAPANRMQHRPSLLQMGHLTLANDRKHQPNLTHLSHGECTSTWWHPCRVTIGSICRGMCDTRKRCGLWQETSSGRHNLLTATIGRGLYTSLNPRWLWFTRIDCGLCTSLCPCHVWTTHISIGLHTMSTDIWPSSLHHLWNAHNGWSTSIIAWLYHLFPSHNGHPMTNVGWLRFLWNSHTGQSMLNVGFQHRPIARIY